MRNVCTSQNEILRISLVERVEKEKKKQETCAYRREGLRLHRAGRRARGRAPLDYFQAATCTDSVRKKGFQIVGAK